MLKKLAQRGYLGTFSMLLNRVFCNFPAKLAWYYSRNRFFFLRSQNRELTFAPSAYIPTPNNGHHPITLTLVKVYLVNPAIGWLLGVYASVQMLPVPVNAVKIEPPQVKRLQTNLGT